MTVIQTIRPSQQVLREALTLAGDLLADIELSRASLSVCMLKGSRVARLVGDDVHQRLFGYEASGYPSGPGGVPPDVFEMARSIGRVKQTTDKNKTVERATIDSVGTLEERIQTNRLALEAAKDPDVSISSANPTQYVWSPSGNKMERDSIRVSLSEDSRQLERCRGYLHFYVASKYDELRFSDIAEDIFARLRTSVDNRIGQAVPQSVKKFAAIYDNLRSDNSEDWANAVHSCRRILQDLADALYPARDDIEQELDGRKIKIKLGKENYINRLVAFVQERSQSDRFNAIVGSHLSFIGDRLDAAFQAAQKGSHSDIADQAEADRYVVYTYMLVADIIGLT